MLKIERKPTEYDGRSMSTHFELVGTTTLREKVTAAIALVKTLPIDGCITGSCLLPDFDPEGWGTTPDVDVFVFGENELVSAIEMARYALKMVPGSGTERTHQQEEWKLARLKQAGLNHKIGITTYKFFCEGVILNLTFKQRKFHGRWVPILDAPGVLQSFDMSIVMQGYDIKHHVLYDMRVGDPKVAVPNPLRDHDCVMWTVAKWVRQENDEEGSDRIGEGFQGSARHDRQMHRGRLPVRQRREPRGVRVVLAGVPGEEGEHRRLVRIAQGGLTWRRRESS